MKSETGLCSVIVQIQVYHTYLLSILTTIRNFSEKHDFIHGHMNSKYHNQYHLSLVIYERIQK